MSQYPLFFTYRDRIFGNGFLAEVASHGRILCATEDDERWVYGVEPGGIAATGENEKAALEAYRQSFTNVLVDLAAEAASFDEFHAAVLRFFAEVNHETEADWKRAVEQVRQRAIDLPIKREDADSECYVLVEQKQQPSFTPKDNEPPYLEPALAA